jgi:hypothetical protein
MKKFILLALISTLAMSDFFTNEAEMKTAESNENARLCEMFRAKVEDYQATMRNDELAAATLESYKQRMSTFCSKSSERS